ncbi:hypothetical protein J6590_085365 [Homalodisca vitripennis]|nr:hypothetical protein J6590_085365 [Homalodisca vitripennis]
MPLPFSSDHLGGRSAADDWLAAVARQVIKLTFEGTQAAHSWRLSVDQGSSRRTATKGSDSRLVLFGNQSYLTETPIPFEDSLCLKRT